MKAKQKKIDRWVMLLGVFCFSLTFVNCTPAPPPLLPGDSENATSDPFDPNSSEGTLNTDKPGVTEKPGVKPPAQAPVSMVYRWSKVQRQGKADLLGVTMPTANHVWAVGDKGTILHSSDAGATWKTQKSGITTRLRAVWFFDSKKGWAVGDKGVILATRNGGQTWTTQQSLVMDDIYAVQFVNAYNGWAVGDKFTLLRTTDGGDSWQSVSGSLDIDLRGLFFRDKMFGYVVGAKGTILYTDNGAMSVMTEPTGTNANFSSAYFFKNNNVWAVGTSGKLLFKDANSGWARVNVSTQSDLRGIHFLDGKRGWIIGKKGILMGTKNAGKTWTSEANGTYPDLHAQSIFSDKAGVIVGKGGAIVRIEATPVPKGKK